MIVYGLPIFAGCAGMTRIVYALSPVPLVKNIYLTCAAGAIIMLLQTFAYPIGAIVYLYDVNALQQQTEALAPFQLPDTPEAHNVVAVVEQYYAILDKSGAPTFDVNEFAKVLVDTSDFTPEPKHEAYIALVVGPQAASKSGYFTAMQARVLHVWHWDELNTAAHTTLQAQTAKGESLLCYTLTLISRAVKRFWCGYSYTLAELQEVVQSNFESSPGGFIAPGSGDKERLIFRYVAVNWDKAIVRYDSLSALQEATLIKIDGHWLIANIKLLRIHFG